jgi:S1-C subfamily serine protease
MLEPNDSRKLCPPVRRRRATLPCSALFAIAAAQGAQAQVNAGAADVFREFADRVLELQVVEVASGAKAEVGSAFYVSLQGHLITNYHVVAKVVHDAERYRAELVDRDGAVRPVEIGALNVVDDLAVVRVEGTPPGHFGLEGAPTAHGARLYSLGNPFDLGIAIVEGTYNGLLQHTLYPRIHFSGALNPGMSGGPTITPAGAVVGVNVSTAGNEVSFLVPRERASALLDRVLTPGYRPPSDFLPLVAEQLLAYQEEYVGALFGEGGDSVVLGPYHLPTQPAEFFNCWADAERSDDAPFEIVTHACSTDDYVFVSRDHASGIVEFRHRVFESEQLNRFQFAALASAEFQGAEWVSMAGVEDVTPFRCRTRNVEHEGLRLRTAFCLRRYRKLDGLYDAVLRAATIGGSSHGLVTTLTLSGVSRQNAARVAQRYLERITWTGN